MTALPILLNPMRGQLRPSGAPAADPPPLRIADGTRRPMLESRRSPQVPVLDLPERLPREERAVREMDFPRDCHFRVTGNRIVGELIAAHLDELMRAGSAAGAGEPADGARATPRAAGGGA